MGYNQKYIDFNGRKKEYPKIGHFYTGRLGEDVECVAFSLCESQGNSTNYFECENCPGLGLWKRLSDNTIVKDCAWGSGKRFYIEILEPEYAKQQSKLSRISTIHNSTYLTIDYVDDVINQIIKEVKNDSQ